MAILKDDDWEELLEDIESFNETQGKDPKKAGAIAREISATYSGMANQIKLGFEKRVEYTERAGVWMRQAERIDHKRENPGKRWKK